MTGTAVCVGAGIATAVLVCTGIYLWFKDGKPVAVVEEAEDESLIVVEVLEDQP